MINKDRRDYFRRYQEEHRDKISAYDHRYYKAHREKRLAQACLWQQGNPEKISAYNRRWYEKHKKEKAAYGRHWQQKNPGKRRVRATRRNARKRDLPDTLTLQQAEHLLLIGQAMYPGEKLDLDHIVPLSRGGGTTLANMHAIPARLNRSKRDALPEDIYRQEMLEPR